MIHSPDNHLLRIEHLYAYVSVDKDGNEGLCAAFRGGTWMPLIAADEARLADLRQIAEELAQHSDKSIRLVRFTAREDVALVTS